MDRKNLEACAVERYMRKKLGGGRSAFARAVDYVVLRLIVLLGAYFMYLPRFEKRGTALLLSAITLALAMLVLHLAGEIRYARFYEKEMHAVRKRLLQDRLLLLDMQSAIPLVSSLCPIETAPVIIQRALPVDANALLSIVRTHAGCGELHVFSCTAYDDTARSFASRTNGLLVLHPPEELFREALQAGMRPTDEEVTASIRADLAFEKRRRNRLRAPTPFADGNARKYALLALLLTAFSFMTAYALYYRMLAGVCMTIAALGAWNRRAFPQGNR